MAELIAQTYREEAEPVLENRVGDEDNSVTLRHADYAEGYSRSLSLVDKMPNGDPPSVMLWGTEE